MIENLKNIDAQKSDIFCHKFYTKDRKLFALNTFLQVYSISTGKYSNYCSDITFNAFYSPQCV